MSGHRVPIVVLLVVLLAASSCGFNAGVLRPPAAQIVVDQRNFEYVKRGIAAEYTVDSIFCAIPLDSKPHGVLLARLHGSAQLKPNQTLVHIAEDQAVRSYIFWCRTTYSLTADVIELAVVE